MMIFGVGLGYGLRTRRRRIASAIVLWWGLGLVIAGFFPLRENADGQTYDPTGLHQPNGAVFFLSMWVGLAILSWCLRPDARWRGLTGYILATGVALALPFVVMVAFAIPSSAPLQLWAGLLQRAVLAVWFPCIIVLATRLWQVRRAQSPTPITPRSLSVV